MNRVTLKKEGKVTPTNTLFMTFGSPDLPKEITVGYLKVKVALFVPTRCVASTATSLATRANVARLLRSVRIAEKISMKVDVRDPSCALSAMVPTLHRLKIAWSGGRKRRFNVPALRNAYTFRNPSEHHVSAEVGQFLLFLQYRMLQFCIQYLIM